ncbi:MAG TPA: hypothetical protein VHA33_05240 [Candidatus Angelobacter sp.]|jgi:hypothetical protein|nr:hypothetical protein [Candidatus Angelobacter sp.]
MPIKTVSFVFLCWILVPCSCALAQNPVSYWSREWHDSSHSPFLSAATRSLLPENALVQANLQVNLDGTAEEVTIYGTPVDELQSEVHILFSREGRVLKNINAYDIVPSGPVEFRAATYLRVADLNAVFFALSVGADGAGTYFFAIDSHHDKHSVIWQQLTAHGRIVLKAGLPALILWQACCTEQDPPVDSCVWCAHRYNVTNFQWRKDRFIATRTYRTNRHLAPELLMDRPILVSTTR